MPNVELRYMLVHKKKDDSQDLVGERFLSPSAHNFFFPLKSGDKLRFDLNSFF